MKHTESLRKIFPKSSDVIVTSIEEIGRFGVLNLGYDGDVGRNPGYIFRGELDYGSPLQSSLERRLQREAGKGAVIIESVLSAAEKSFVESFVLGEAQRILAATKAKPEPIEDVFWWLSLMQHYRHPTRLVDFTRDVRVALFFAVEHSCNWKKHRTQLASEHLVIYCFPCKDPTHPFDPNNNKTPFSPIKVDANRSETVDMNKAIGCQIRLAWMEQHQANFKEFYREKNQQKRPWGWDKPRYENPRLSRQKGMFVYPFPSDDFRGKFKLKKEASSWLVTQLAADHSFAASGLAPQRLLIPFERVGQMKDQLEAEFGLTKATVYVVLHVACALALRAKRFATFDERQLQLAEAAGLEVE